VFFDGLKSVRYGTATTKSWVIIPLKLRPRFAVLVRNNLEILEYSGLMNEYWSEILGQVSEHLTINH